MPATETSARHNARIEMMRDVNGSVLRECRYRDVSPSVVVEERLDKADFAASFYGFYADGTSYDYEAMA